MRCKNEEKTLLLALNSISKIADEIIFIDNNSTDNTLKIAREFKDTHCVDMTIAKFEKDILKFEATLADYYNYALSFATGDWIIKWDGDLFAEDDLCKKIRQCIIDNDKSEFDGIYLRNKIIRGSKMFVSYGSECAIFRNEKGRTFFIDASNTQHYYEELLDQNKMVICGDLYDYPVWHIRFETPKEFVKSRLFFMYLHLKPCLSFEQFVEKYIIDNGNISYNEMEQGLLKGALEDYNKEKHGIIPKEILELK